MDRLIKELGALDIQRRDRWQFEQKSAYYPPSKKNKTTYLQEFYIFVPNSLHVNPESYKKTQFYRDLTTLIRYKTPVYTVYELASPEKISSILSSLKKDPDFKKISISLKVLANIIRSAIREETQACLKSYDQKKIKEFIEAVVVLKNNFRALPEKPGNNWPYIDEFLSNSLLDHLVLLYKTADSTNQELLRELLKKEMLYLEQHHGIASSFPQKEDEQEHKLYRHDLLNKYMLTPLVLSIFKSSLLERYGNIIGIISAGSAMLIFFVLFIHQGRILLINSTPFIIATVLLYILKDRIKEIIRTFAYNQFAKRASDYKTNIYAPDKKSILGTIKEYFTFLKAEELPEAIEKARNRAFHEVLERFPRPETILYYKRSLHLYRQKNGQTMERKALNLIFRLHIQKFLEKASDPYHTYLTLSNDHSTIEEHTLKKVYHINIILKTTVNVREPMPLQRYRVVCTKNNILRVEDV